MAPSGVMWLSHVHGRSRPLAAGSDLLFFWTSVFQILEQISTIFILAGSSGVSQQVVYAEPSSIGHVTLGVTLPGVLDNDFRRHKLMVFLGGSQQSDFDARFT